MVSSLAATMELPAAVLARVRINVTLSSVSAKRKASKGFAFPPDGYLQTELEACHDPEVSTASPQAPEELGVAGVADLENVAVCDHDLCRNEIIDRQPKPPGGPAHASTKCQATRTGMRDYSGGDYEAVFRSNYVNVSQKSTAADNRSA